MKKIIFLIAVFVTTNVYADEKTDIGRKIFLDRCTSCHGQKGEGIIGPAIGCHGVKNKTDKFLYDVIYHGRKGDHGIDMPSWGTGDPVEETDLVKEFRATLNSNKNFSPAQVEEFAMKIFGKDSELFYPEKKGMDVVRNYGPLRKNEIREVISYLRILERIQEKETPKECIAQEEGTAVQGNKESGKKIFMDICSKCHGKDGRGDSFFDGKDISPRDFTDKIYMQAKTDSYLKTVIKTGGLNQGRSGIMSPLHITEKEIDDVIAYVRTLDD